MTSYLRESGTALNTTVPYSKAGISEDEGIITNTLFQKVHRLENQNLYIRAHWGNLPLKTSTGMENNSMVTKPAFLMVFDNQFNSIMEIPIDRNKYFPDNSFVTSTGMYLWRDFTRTVDEDSLRLGIVKVQ